MYLVVLCKAIVAPSLSGFCRYGDAKVLSTVSISPYSRATFATARMSRTTMSGLVGDSIQTVRVLGRTARASYSGSRASTLLKVIP